MPLAMMEEALVPLFLHHRYQMEAAAKAIGGQYTPMRCAATASRRAGPCRLPSRRPRSTHSPTTLRSSELVVPSRVLDALAPRPSSYELHRDCSRATPACRSIR